MIQKQRRATAVVSVLLVKITITLTLTLTASATATSIEKAAEIPRAEASDAATATLSTTIAAIDERTTAANTTTKSTSRSTLGAAEKTTAAAAAISKWQQGNEKATTTTMTKTAAAETTTTTFLTLQPPPPYDLTSPTTSSYEPESKSTSTSKSESELTAAESEAATPNSKDVTANETSSSPKKNSINHEFDKADIVAVKQDKNNGDKRTTTTTAAVEEKPENEQQISQQQTLSGKLNSVLEGQSMSPQGFRKIENADTPSVGYINFEQNDSIEATANSKPTKSQTINEVLTSLFPNGFSDVFRFSHASKETTATPENEQVKLESTTNATPTAFKSKLNQTKASIRYTTSVSKEYRRLVRPGHTEIVVENLAIIPIASDEFKDGSNSISKDELLRINRAAVDAPVLPSMLIEPASPNKNATAAVGAATAPIVILKESSGEQDDFGDDTVDDNLIAESQDVVQHIFQRLPDASDKHNYKHKTPEVNVEIIEDNTLRQTQKRAFGQRLFTPAKELPKNELQTKGALANQANTNQENPHHNQDHFQQHAEQAFRQPGAVSEAPSRQFLKNFKPQLSESASGFLFKKGQFHYESIGREQRLQSSTPAPPGDYGGIYVKPAAQLEYQNQLRTEQEQSTPKPAEVAQLHTHITSSQQVSTSGDYKGYEATPIQENSTPTNNVASDGVVFVTINTPSTDVTPAPTPLPLFVSDPANKTPHDYVAEAVSAASQNAPQHIEEPKQSEGYTYVEVQKSVNIHNKLITEKDGQLVEQHETIYPQPQYAENVATNNNLENAQQTPNEYVSLSTNPINVQQLDDDHNAHGETHEEAASHTSSHQVQAPPAQQSHTVVEKIIAQPYPVPVEKIVDRPYPVTQYVEKQVPAPYPVKEVVEKFVDRPVEVEKLVDRPVKVPYPVQVNHYIDRPYPVHEIIEQPYAVPYAVPEPVPVPVAVETYIDRPYPVETIVEKRIPYPVEKIVEKIVEKHVPVEVERIVEKPKVVEKIVEKLVDRPVAVPIQVPVAISLPHHTSHPNSLSWSNHYGSPQPQYYQKIPHEVLQNYYTRMLKKLLHPTSTGHTSATPAQTSKTKPTQPTTPIQFTKPPFKISDIRYDLKPPPPPLGPSWSKGARYIYNTLPAQLLSALDTDQVYAPQQQILFVGTAPSKAKTATSTAAAASSYDEFQRWRNGHLLKRSPDFGRNLHIEYGFKPPLVPSLEIDENGMPLKANSKSDNAQ